MKEYIIIAWRNILRNKKRTLITVSSVFFATFLALIMRSFQLGSYDYMINSMIESYSGYLTVENKDFPDEQIIDNSIEYSPEIISKIKNTENIKSVVPRLSYFSLASFGKQTKGILFTGIIPYKENQMTKLKNKIVKFRLTKSALSKILKTNLSEELKEKLKLLENNSYSDKNSLLTDLKIEKETKSNCDKTIFSNCEYNGEYLSENDDGILISDRLSKFLKINTGDTLVMIGQGRHGASAQGLFAVKGIVKILNPKLDNLLIYGELKTVQEYYSAYEISENSEDTTRFLSTYSVNIINKSKEDIELTKKRLSEVLNNNDIIIRDWKQSNKELAQQINSDDKSGQMMLGILYIVIAFGLFGTVLMMTAERKREMGIMLALGMKKIKLGIITTIEMFFIAFIGLFFGIIGSVPIVLAGYYNPIRLTGDTAKLYEDMGFEPIMPTAWFGEYYLNQVIVVLIIVLLIMIYPVINILRLKVIDALK